MKVVKIVQNPESGKIGLQVKHNEEHDIDGHLQLLTEFVSEQAVKTHELRKSIEEIVTRLGKCEKKLSEIIENQKVN
jgi:hypothetical protein